MNEELTLAGIDLPDLMKRLMGNTNLLKVLLKKFMADGTYAKLTEALAAGNMKEAEMASHTLKGMCGNLSLKELFNLFQAQVTALRANDLAAARGMEAEIDEKYQATLGHLNAWIEAN